MLNPCFGKSQKFSFRNEIVKKINDNSEPMFPSSHSDTNKIVANRELKYAIENILEAVPFGYRMVFPLREINGLNVAERLRRNIRARFSICSSYELYC